LENLKEHGRSAGSLMKASGNCADEEVGGVEITSP